MNLSPSSTFAQVTKSYLCNFGVLSFWKNNATVIIIPDLYFFLNIYLFIDSFVILQFEVNFFQSLSDAPKPIKCSCDSGFQLVLDIGKGNISLVLLEFRDCRAT